MEVESVIEHYTVTLYQAVGCYVSPDQDMILEGPVQTTANTTTYSFFNLYLQVPYSISLL